LNAVEEEHTTKRISPDWETELWSYISQGDGITCPLSNSCPAKQDGKWCLSDNRELFNEWYGDHASSFSRDKLEFNAFLNLVGRYMPRPWIPGRIFQLTEALANRYLERAGLNQPPVTTEFIRQFDISPRVEIRTLPLKAYHGAVWHVEDGWVVHLNKGDKSAKQKVTLFHEVFHILAHTKAGPVFRKHGISKGVFNEILADYFAGCVLIPRVWVRAKWTEVNDLKQMAEIFEVTKVSMWLRTMGLI
jgi:hypothetical protein